MMLSRLDKEIVKLLRRERLLTTYQIAKKLQISWSTANSHCYKLMSLNKLSCRREKSKFGLERVVWWVK